MTSPSPTGPPLQVLLPLSAGIVYVVAALFLKRAAELGANMWRTARVCNFTIALMFVPLTLLGGNIPSWELWWQPALVALLFMAGQLFTLLALQDGEVTVATPVLGLKVPMVALFTATLLGERIGPKLWTAALLCSLAIVLLNFSRAHSHHRVGATILLAALAASAYALFDVLVQHWSPAWGAGRFLPVLMGFVAVGSLALRPFGRAQKALDARTPAAARGWVVGGALCLGLQGLLLVTAVAIYKQAAVANVLYGSRGLWSVMVVWWIGHWFANRERQQGSRVLAWRLTGAALLLAAIVLVLPEAHPVVTAN